MTEPRPHAQSTDTIVPQAPLAGKTLGIVAFVLSFFVQPIALILGIVALVQSRKAGRRNGFAVAAIIIAVVLMVIALIVVIAVTIGARDALAACQAIDFDGTVTLWGQEVTCRDSMR